MPFLKENNPICPPGFEPPPLLTLMLYTWCQNRFSSQNRRRYSNELKDLATMIKFYCGGVGYNFLRENLPGILPEQRTMDRYKSLKCDTLPLGPTEIMFEKAATFFKGIGYEGPFNLGLDETATVTGLQWNERDGTLCGMSKTSEGTYNLPANNFDDFITAFKKCEFASVVRVYILTPMDRTKPSFVVALIPSAKRETKEDLLIEWQNIKEMACKSGVAIVATGMDGEPKQLSAQRSFMTSTDNEFFEFKSKKFVGIKIPVHKVDGKLFPMATFQDPTHVGGKERNNLLSTTKKVKIGEHDINLDGVRNLLQDKTEVRMGLRPSDLAPKDKMNSEAVRRLCSFHTIEALQVVKDPTWFYLKFMNYSSFSFISTTLSLRERIKQAAYAAYFAVTWRTMNESKYRITANQLQCVVMNFVNLVSFMSFYHHHFPNDPIAPWIFGSQENEQFFRTLRLMGGNFSSGINFTIRDVLYKASTICYVQNLEKIYQGLIKVPMHKKHMKQSSQFKDETCSEMTVEFLEECIQEGITELIVDLSSLDIKTKICSDADLFAILSLKPQKVGTVETVADDPDEPDEEYLDESDTLLQDFNEMEEQSVAFVPTSKAEKKKATSHVIDHDGNKIHKRRLCTMSATEPERDTPIDEEEEEISEDENSSSEEVLRKTSRKRLRVNAKSSIDGKNASTSRMFQEIADGNVESSSN